MAIIDPLLQEVGEVRQFEEVVRGAAYFGRGTGDGGNWIDQIRRRVGCAALFAVIAVLIDRVALWAGAFDEAIG